jgi:dihydrofolate synthase/folylpolyglutamate synthase
VAGTNGKGSTSLLIEALLLAGQQTVGSFISPHLVHITERVRIAGQEVSEVLFCHAFTQIAQFYGDEPVVWFEFLALVAFWLFKQQPLDYLVLELGLGGRYDILNALSPVISVITSIGLDHQALLGNSRDEIGWQKAGIFRQGKAAICGDASPPQSVLDYAREIDANLLIQKKDFKYKCQGDTWQWQFHKQMFSALPRPAMPLANASTALAVLSQCPEVELSQQTIKRILATIKIPGRLQLIQLAPQVLVDVAHNPQACANLKHFLLAQPVSGKEFAVIGMKADKDFASCLALFSQFFAHIFIAALEDNMTAINQYQIYFQEQAAEQEVTYCLSPTDAYKKAEAIADNNDRITIFGSFQMVGPILKETVKRES